MPSRQKTGKEAEKLAVKYLKKEGYKILAQRFSCKWGEIDIICRKGKLIVFVEVRSTTQPEPYSPEASINQKKIQNLVRTAQLWMAQKRLKNLDWRFDLITVRWSQTPVLIQHYPGFMA